MYVAKISKKKLLFSCAVTAHALVRSAFSETGQYTQLNSTQQRASMDAGVKTPQCPHLSSINAQTRLAHG